MSQSPKSLNQRRRSSSLSLPVIPTKSRAYGSGASFQTQSHESSILSVHSPTTSWPQSVLGKSQDFLTNSDFSANDNVGSGIGSLADELAEEEWDDGEEMEDTVTAVHKERCRNNTILSCHHVEPAIDPHLASVPYLHGNINGFADQQDLSKWKSQTNSRDYDGSDYGGVSDLEVVEGISSTLEAEMALIESLAWHGDASTDRKTDAFARMTAQLEDLRSQASIEGHATR